MTFIAVPNGGTAGATERALLGPVGGIYAPVPYFDEDAPAYLVIDMRDWPPQTYFRLSAINDDILYCFFKTATEDMELGYQYDGAFGVPDIIGVGTSVRELWVPTHPFLYIKSTALVADETNPEIRLRHA